MNLKNAYWYFTARLGNRFCDDLIKHANSKKELVAVDDGFRESKESWQALLLDLKNRGLTHAPKLAVGDGSLVFWGANRAISWYCTINVVGYIRLLIF